MKFEVSPLNKVLLNIKAPITATTIPIIYTE